jgi:succinyl-diaminopimelate desuccinylase
MPNFKKLAKGYTKNAERALQELVKIPSVYDEGSKKEGQPYGAKIKEALDYVAKLGTDFGFAVDKCDGYCTELSIGEGGNLVGIYAHSDVVPTTGVWTNPPFDAVIKDGRMWGRGTADDKGPLIASLYAIKLLKDHGFLKGYRVRLVSGGDEERGSSCLKYYFEHLKKEECDYGFTPDADWPLIYAEKGISNAIASGRFDLSPILAMDGGVVTNAVCDKLLVTLKKDEEFEQYLRKNAVDCDISSFETIDIITFKGKAAHGSTPELGVNAALIAFKYLGQFYHLDELSKIATVLSDPSGKLFNAYDESSSLGRTTFNFGIVKYDGKTLSLSVDFRYGETCAPKLCLENLGKATGLTVTLKASAPYLLYNQKSPLVSTLMKAYKRETLHLFDKPLAIGGGTYAKEAKNTVAFGAASKAHPGSMHSPNEYIYLSDFEQDIAIYARAIYMLGHLKK